MQNLNLNNKTLKVLLWGFGHMNKVILRYLIEKNHKIVAVIGHHNIGQNAYEIAGLSSSESVKITSDEHAQDLILENRPDVCILATKSLIKEIYESLTLLGKNGISTITIAEEAFYSWYSSPTLTSELNALFKSKNATFTGTGSQDIFWGFLPSSLVGSSHSINKIIGSGQFNVGQ